MVARDFFEVLISYEFFSMTVLKVARKSIGERVKDSVRDSKKIWFSTSHSLQGLQNGLQEGLH